MMDGVLVIDKPRGPTSHDVVSDVRRALRVKKVGHTGTLDPMATGVLPLVLGTGTKLARYLTGHDKTYRATFVLGITTRTLDAEGEVTQTRPVNVSPAALAAALAAQVGDIQQLPPMYSAKKVAGKKLYTLARRGLEVERDTKAVHVDFINLVRFESPQVEMDVRCSAGTYVRVLAHDIGEALGCGAHLIALRRIHAGPFAIEQAVTLQSVVDDPSKALSQVVPLGRALSALPRLNVPQEMARLIASGYQLNVADLRSLDTPFFVNDAALAVGIDGGHLIAVMRTQLASDDIPLSRRDRRALKTERVLARVGLN